MDKIIIKGLHFYGYHGVFPEERKKGQPFIVDLTLETDMQAAGLSDALEDTVDYSAVCRTVQDIVEGRPYQLLEKVATVIADRVLEEYQKIETIEVTLHKPQAPIPGKFDDIAIAISRKRP